MTIHIREAEVADAPAIAAGNRAMAWETEHKRLDEATVRRGVDAVFADSGKGFFLVAELDGEVVGQLMITLEWSDWRNGWFWWIQSVYVLPAHREQGVFRRLFEAVIERANAKGDVVGLRLYVEKDNTRAQQVYQKLLMNDARYAVFERMLSG